MWSQAQDKDNLMVKTNLDIGKADSGLSLKTKRSAITLIQRKIVLAILHFRTYVYLQNAKELVTI